MSLMGRMRTLSAQFGLLVLLLIGAVVVVGAAICWGVLAGFLAMLVGLGPGAAFMIGLVGGILGLFPTVKAALWVRGRLGRPPEKSVEELTEVF